jgi:hypothetical protein
MTEKYILDLLWHTNITPISKSIEMEDNLFLNLIWTICNIWYAL